MVKEFGPLRVLDGVSLDVARGQTVAIVGRSGSGKSTLLRCIAGLETVQGGGITVCGHEVGRPGSAALHRLEPGDAAQQRALARAAAADDGPVWPRATSKPTPSSTRSGPNP